MTHLSRRTRIFLALLGFIFLIAAILTLAYAFAPGSQSRQQFPLPPDAFVTPEARHSDWEIGSIPKIEPILNTSSYEFL